MFADAGFIGPGLRRREWDGFTAVQLKHLRGARNEVITLDHFLEVLKPMKVFEPCNELGNTSLC